MSTSYPYLTVARNYNVPYGAVLSLVDEIETKGTQFMRNNVLWQAATLNAWYDEQLRREIVNCPSKAGRWS